MKMMKKCPHCKSHTIKNRDMLFKSSKYCSSCNNPWVFPWYIYLLYFIPPLIMFSLLFFTSFTKEVISFYTIFGSLVFCPILFILLIDPVKGGDGNK